MLLGFGQREHCSKFRPRCNGKTTRIRVHAYGNASGALMETRKVRRIKQPFGTEPALQQRKLGSTNWKSTHTSKTA